MAPEVKIEIEEICDASKFTLEEDPSKWQFESEPWLIIRIPYLIKFKPLEPK